MQPPGRTLPKPQLRPGFVLALLLGAGAGIVQSLLLHQQGETWTMFCVPGLVLGAVVGLAARHGWLLAVPAFYASGLATAGVLGHLNLLPCAMFFFGLPTLLFGAAAYVTSLLLVLALPPARVPPA